MAKKKLGEVLVQRRSISAADLEKALADQQKGAGLLGELLLDRGLVCKEDLVAALEEICRFSYVDARFATVEKAALLMVPYSVATRYCLLPVVREGKKIVAIMAEPQNLNALKELEFITGTRLSPRLGFRSEILEAVKKCYGELQTSSETEQGHLPFIDQVDTSDMQFFTASASERNKAAMAEFEAELRQERTPAVRLVSAMLAAASVKGASDVHIQPHVLGTAVRIRVDGVMRELTHIPYEMTAAVVSRIKILADLDIAERRLPQDGRFLVQVGKVHLDIRVSTVPTHDGNEKVALRILNPEGSRVGFQDLGVAPEIAGTLANLLAAPQGTILVTGPTGSGKSTTLYAALNVLHTPSVHIITVEDPVEYKIEGVNQIQVLPKTGLTFAAALRSILRQDPNVIMVGEIRDVETAEIALQAAQTGHMVLSTLHTNDSVSAVTRLLDLGIPGFLIASSLTAILAQRLVRRLCDCHDTAPMSRECEARLLAGGIVDFPSTMHIPVGCARCDNSGYRGRLGIYELLVLDEQMRACIRSTFRDDEIRNLARSGGMRLMQEDALQKVCAGITTIDEILRVVPFDQAAALRCRSCGKALAPAFLFCPYCGAGARQAGGRGRGSRVATAEGEQRL